MKYFDAAIIVPLQEEFEQIVKHFDVKEDFTEDKEIILSVSLKNIDLKLLLVRQVSMGKSAASNAVHRILQNYSISALFCLGIAGGISKDINIGDVCYSKKIVDYLENSKISDDQAETSIEFETGSFEANPRLVNIIDINSIIDPGKDEYWLWRELRLEASQKLIPGEFSGKSGMEKIQLPKASSGNIACAAVSASGKYNKSLKGGQRKIAAVETESGGIFEVASDRGIPCLTIRGISDYAGNDKEKFEKETNNKAREIAIENAATFCVLQLRSANMLAWFEKCRGVSESEQMLPLPDTISESERIFDALDRQTLVIDERLKSLAPGYSLQSKGYQLPVPRIRVAERRTINAEEMFSDPLEFSEALRTSRVLVISLPRQYPDASLAWVIGKHFLTVNADGKQYIPSVISATTLHRPSRGLLENSDAGFKTFVECPNVKLLYIVDDFNFASKTQSDFLIEQIEVNKNAEIIVITKSSRKFIDEVRFLDRVGADIASVCDISFLETVSFLHKNFELSVDKSQYIALKLRDTFKNFNLTAHPSYFSGIPLTTLSELLKANRRSELLSLAVAGYLSYVRAKDASAIPLSRTIREEFLEDLAFNLNVEKREYSSQDLVGQISALSEKHDFDVSPATFISQFEECGILHFENGSVKFTLNFIEQYLVAKRLRATPSAAKSYFALDQDDFNFNVFSIYAELGASDEIVQIVRDRLTSSLEELKITSGGTSAIANEKLNPVLLQRMERNKSLEKRIQAAVKSIRDDNDETHEKQRLLDASDRIRERAASAAREEETPERQALNDSIKGATDTWLVAITLLGSGAERLTADIKRDLISKVINLSGLMVEAWSAWVQRIDFAAFKKGLIDDEEMIDLLAAGEKKKRAEAQKTLEGLADLLEFVALSEPFGRIVTILSEEARDKVLVKSIVNTPVDGQPNGVIRATWLSDLDPETGVPEIQKSLRDLPNAKFLRFNLATHLILRSYWRQYEKNDKLRLLDAAGDCVQKFGISYDKPRLLKMIDDATSAEVAGE